MGTKINNAGKLIAGLNSRQKAAVTYDSGPLLVLAGAGSGKTKVLTHRVAYFIAEKGLKPENALLLTFTNKAAGEMKERIISLSGKNPPYSGTFHSFCAKLLRKDGRVIGISPGFIIYDDTDQKEMVKQILEEFNYPSDSFAPSAILHDISDAKNQLISFSQYREIAQGDWGEVVSKVYGEYEKRLKDIGALDFDDLLIKAVLLFKKSPETLKKWQKSLTHIYVDEWQDTNKIQHVLTRLLVGERKNLTAVGDASQSIYGWRGADFRNISYLMRDFPKIKVINLEQNYRSTQNILTAANSVISKNTSHPILKLWTLNPDGERIKIYTAKNGLDEASFTISEISSLLDRGFSWGDVAVLYRTNAQSRVLEEAMLHSAIPYVLVGGVRFYDRKEIKDVLSLIRLVVNSRDSVSSKRIQKLGKRRYEKLQEVKKEIDKPEKYTTLDLLDLVLEKTDYLALYKKESEENFTRLENIKELRSVATEFPNTHDFLENVSLVETQRNNKKLLAARPAEKQDAVTLMTLHAAKGLEFPVVFIVGMEEGLFPHSRSLLDPGQLEEERRLAYVGMTRAKKMLYISYAINRLYFGEKTSNPPSRFIMDIPEGILENTDILPSRNSRDGLDINDIKGTFDDIIEKYLE